MTHYRIAHVRILNSLERYLFPAVFLLRGDPVGELSLTPSNTTKETNDHPVLGLDSNTNSTRTEKKQVAKRDERRRATHNEVERRRRDKINSWIMKLGSIIPDACESPNTRHAGPVDGLSKGGILAAACEYINELKEELTRHKLEVSTLCETSQFLMEENTRLQQENQQLNAGIQELKEILTRHGIPTDTATKEKESNSVTLNNALSS